MVFAFVVLALILAAIIGLPNLIKYRKKKINAKAEALGQERIFNDV